MSTTNTGEGSGAHLHLDSLPRRAPFALAYRSCWCWQICHRHNHRQSMPGAGKACGLILLLPSRPETQQSLRSRTFHHAWPHAQYPIPSTPRSREDLTRPKDTGRFNGSTIPRACLATSGNEMVQPLAKLFVEGLVHTARMARLGNPRCPG